MAELTIDPASIRKALDDFVSSYKPSDTPTQEVGYVATAGDGIAHVTGLPGCMANELLTFEDGTLGLAFNLDAREIGVVILGDFAGIEEGQEVRRTGEVLSVPVGDGYLGRVVDPLGNPIDGLGEIKTEGRRILEAQAPDVMHRHPVDEPLSTGLKAIDAMTPIGRGQRQLIIGDRQTGKTAIAIDTIINQKKNWESGDPKKQVRCIKSPWTEEYWKLYDSGASSEELDQFCRGTVAAARDGIIERGAFSAGMISGLITEMKPAAKIITDIMENGQVTDKAYMAIKAGSMTEQMAAQYNINVTQGVFVYAVEKGGAGEKAGLQLGDVITKLNDTEITSMSDLSMAKKGFKAGDTVTLTVWRGGQEITLSLTFDEQPQTTGTEDDSSNQNQGQQDSYGDLYDYFFGRGNGGRGN